MKLTRGRRSPPCPSSTPVSRVTSIGASVVVVVVEVDVVDVPEAPVATGPSAGELVEEGGRVVVVVVVVVVTSSTASPLGTVSGAVVVGVGSTSAITFTGHVVERIGDEHHDARLGRDVGDLARRGRRRW